MLFKIMAVCFIVSILVGCGVSTKPTPQNIQTYHNEFKELRKWNHPPDIRGYRAKEMVEYFNAILPPTFQLRYDASEIKNPLTPKRGEIKISKLGKSKWPKKLKAGMTTQGIATSYYEGRSVVKGRILMDVESTGSCLFDGTLRHEMMHALGFLGAHVETFSDSILQSDCSGRNPNLTDIDKAALRKLYEN